MLGSSGIWTRDLCGGIECPAVCDFLGAFFLDALYVFESLKCMHIYLNLVKINCFLDIFQNNFIKIQSSNVPSCPEFWTGFLLMYFVLIINHIWWTNKILQVRKVSNRAWYLEVFGVFFLNVFPLHQKRLFFKNNASFFKKKN